MDGLIGKWVWMSGWMNGCLWVGGSKRTGGTMGGKSGGLAEEPDPGEMI